METRAPNPRERFTAPSEYRTSEDDFALMADKKSATIVNLELSRPSEGVMALETEDAAQAATPEATPLEPGRHRRVRRKFGETALNGLRNAGERLAGGVGYAMGRLAVGFSSSPNPRHTPGRHRRRFAVA